MNPVQWHGDIGLIKRYQRGNDIRYDLAQYHENDIRVYYGVTEEGLHEQWQIFSSIDEES